MLLSIFKYTIIFFGAFIILVGFLMLFAPEKARATLRKAGSTNFINYAEITIRLIPGIALFFYAEHSKFPLAFEILSWIILISSLILYAIPRKWHHSYSMKSADILKPIYVRLISPLAFLFGSLIIYNAL